MNVIRPIGARDLDVLIKIAKQSGPGFTSLPDNPKLLAEKIARSERAFAGEPAASLEASYLFVLENLGLQQVIGTCGIEASVGISSPWYHYRMGTLVHQSRELNVRNQHSTLYLCNDYTGHSEVCTLYLMPEHRRSGNGPLLSKSRFLFMAQYPERFAERVIAEMRGVSDEDGTSPFWEGLGKRFFGIEFSHADYLTGMGNKSFIAELMPIHPIYVHMLPESAQQVIGKVHKNTEPARKMLENEGFRFEGYIDIFDGGPTLVARLDDIRSVYGSQHRRVLVRDCGESNSEGMVCNTRLTDFRATITQFYIDHEADAVCLNAEQAEALQVKTGDTLRILRKGV